MGSVSFRNFRLSNNNNNNNNSNNNNNNNDNNEHEHEIWIVVSRFLKKLNKQGFLSDTVYNNITPKGSQLARIYGLPKLHKSYSPNSSPPLRPIVSTIGTFNYKLSKFLCSLLSPHLPSDYCPKDPFTFIDELKKVSFKNSFVVSYDVVSLFTNIPLDETIELALDLILKNNLNIKITRNDLKKLFIFATSKTQFSFKNEIYQQTDGVAMGSPLAPVLANLFMGHHEKLWINEFQGNKPRFYRRYVDDIFATFQNASEAENFLNHINNKHQNIKFTMEVEQNKTLAFLDILINFEKDLTTSVYRKKTYTGLLTNYLSFTPFQYKIGLIRTLLDRTYKIKE